MRKRYGWIVGAAALAIVGAAACGGGCTAQQKAATELHSGVVTKNIGKSTLALFRKCRQGDVAACDDVELDLQAVIQSSEIATTPAK